MASITAEATIKIKFTDKTETTYCTFELGVGNAVSEIEQLPLSLAAALEKKIQAIAAGSIDKAKRIAELEKALADAKAAAAAVANQQIAEAVVAHEEAAKEPKRSKKRYEA